MSYGFTYITLEQCCGHKKVTRGQSSDFEWLVRTNEGKQPPCGTHLRMKELYGKGRYQILAGCLKIERTSDSQLIEHALNQFPPLAVSLTALLITLRKHTTRTYHHLFDTQVAP